MNGRIRTMISSFFRINSNYLGLVLLMLLPYLASGQNPKGQVLDKIVAKIDNYIVLKSELEKTHLEMLSRGQASGPNLQCQILQNLIMNKVMVAKAEIDSIIILDAEVELNLDRRFSVMVTQIGSEKAIEEYYGKSISEFKEELKPQVHEQLVIQKMEAVISQEISVTPSEVKKFFRRIPGDSLPYFSKEVEVAEIVKFPEISKAQKQKVSEPNMSDGIRSGVNCIRLKVKSRAEAIVWINKVLARPGTPISSACPWQKIVINTCLTTSSCPMMTLEISAVSF